MPNAHAHAAADEPTRKNADAIDARVGAYGLTEDERTKLAEFVLTAGPNAFSGLAKILGIEALAKPDEAGDETRPTNG